MLNKNIKHDLIKQRQINLIKFMQTKAETTLNPFRYHLSSDAKKRLRWMYVLYHEQGGNVSRAANKIGISRQWLSSLKSVFERNNKDPRSLEPESKSPGNTEKRNRISKEIESRIMWVRGKYGWGKDKIEAYLKNEERIKVNHNTVNKYLHIHKKIDPKISLKNSKAMEKKKERERDINLKTKFRAPSNIKDLAPGALVEKDMKYIAILGPNKEMATGRDFWYQHTCLDSFTRIRTMELTKDFESSTAVAAYQEASQRMPFKVACVNVDNGSENRGQFSEYLQKEEVFQFYSNTATPTDNPRVERSHLSDELEFYGKGNHCDSFEKQKDLLKEWEYIYNYLRPHQALGQMTPVAFYELWKRDPEKAMKIVEKWQVYLKKQSKRLASSRRIKKREQIDALMKFIEAKLENNNDLKDAKLKLINCQLCSMA